MIRIRGVEPMQGFVVRLEFTDGSQKIGDLEHYLHGPIFEPLRHDLSLFRSVRVDPISERSFGAIVRTSIQMSCTMTFDRHGWKSR